MTGPSVSHDDRRVLLAYGRTMLSVQLFELSLRGLVQSETELPEGGLEEAWAVIEPLFRMTAGQLKNRLALEDEDLLEELTTAVSTRNTLAHEYLLLYRMRAALEDRPPGDAVAELEMIADKFDVLTQQLDELTAERDQAEGIDPHAEGLSLEEARRLWLDQGDE